MSGNKPDNVDFTTYFSELYAGLWVVDQENLSEDERLAHICGEMMEEPAEIVLDRIVDRVRGWSGMLQDDIALLALEWDRP
jgi:hypothetical protein